MPEAANALPRGYSLLEYRVESVLGTGGFGVTYLATDANLNLKVALKEYLPDDFAARAGDSSVQPKPGDASESFQWGLQRFMDEAKTLASFRHPNIVRVMRFFEANKTGYMVMEFVEGKSLPEWIGTRRPLPQKSLEALVGPLLDGLAVIHKAGFLHRDIKPANIFMRDDGSPVLLDFGSARELKGRNQELTAVVSPGYAPLEQYHTQGKQGPWSDLYAFGGVLYWMLTGNKPVEAAARVRQDIMTPAVTAAGGRGYTPDFLAVVDWALKPNEDERPQSVAEFKRRLMGGAQTEASERTIPLSAAEPTVIARPVEAGGTTGLTGVALDREQVKRIENEMARHIGPIAQVVVRNAAKKSPSIPALAEAVASEIADEKARAAFIRKFVSGEATSKPSGNPTRKATEVPVSQKFTPEVLQKAETALAQHIGAIARVVVKQAAAKARDEAELYLLIADEIKDPAERKNFTRKAVSISGKR
ncbi:MAG TPA: serine/threonine-protein kinase [Burkholderiales bacterium]|nr:serine/threonine-protein kinase [Burkholderiales bacterium]